MLLFVAVVATHSIAIAMSVMRLQCRCSRLVSRTHTQPKATVFSHECLRYVISNVSLFTLYVYVYRAATRENVLFHNEQPVFNAFAHILLEIHIYFFRSRLTPSIRKRRGNACERHGFQCNENTRCKYIINFIVYRNCIEQTNNELH